MKSKFTRRQFVGSSIATIAIAQSTFASASYTKKIQLSDGRPNIVVIVVDDMRFDEFSAGGHPYLKTPAIDALLASGAYFPNAYHTTPLCSPNRASILTGQYASRHGILDNTSRSYASHKLLTFAVDLQSAGYETAHIGKWHMGNDPTPRPGFDYWVCFPGQGKLIDPDLYEDGRIHRVEGYITDLLTDRAVGFIERKRERPFLLYLAHKALHEEVKQLDDGSVDMEAGKFLTPAPRHMGAYAGKEFPRRPNYGFSENVRKNKPVIANALIARESAGMKAFLFSDEIKAPMISDEEIQQRAEMMLAIDEGVGQIIRTLEDNGLRENTLVVFSSDNGSFFGEHGLGIERRLPFEESIKNPLIISFPMHVNAATRVADFVLSIDIAPTIVAAAGIKPPSRMQGQSLMPLLLGADAKWRQSFLVEYFAHENPFPWLNDLDYRAVRLGKFKYIDWIKKENMNELYDLERDPFELHNVINDPDMRGVLERLKTELATLILKALGIDSDISQGT